MSLCVEDMVKCPGHVFKFKKQAMEGYIQHSLLCWT